MHCLGSFQSISGKISIKQGGTGDSKLLSQDLCYCPKRGGKPSDDKSKSKIRADGTMKAGLSFLYN